SSGQATDDMPALLAHYRDQEHTPGHGEFKWALLHVDILAGELVAAKRKILSMPEASPETAPSSRHLLMGSVNFLEGRNDEAMAEYRQALKLYAKEIGRRKVFFEGSNGLFFLLGLIWANDSTLHAEIQLRLWLSWRLWLPPWLRLPRRRCGREAWRCGREAWLLDARVMCFAACPGC